MATHDQGRVSTLPRDLDTTDAAFLLANNEAYEWATARLLAMDPFADPESTLQQVALAARCAVVFHAGRFADGTIENVALQVGVRLRGLVSRAEGFVPPPARSVSRRRLLHVASSVLGVGGLTRMIYHWITNDPDSTHSVVLLQQEHYEVPAWLVTAVSERGGDFVVLPCRAPLSHRALWLRDLAVERADLVVLHHGGFDPIPTVAFASEDCPPVAVLNHADHEFWLGGSVTDLVINLRTAGALHTAARRHLANNTVIPIPLDPAKDRPSRLDARAALGIPARAVVLLSVARAQKFLPCGEFDFVGTASAILDQNPDAQMLIVGASEQDVAPFLRRPPHPRLVFCGRVENASTHHAAADVYLETFPFGSQTAALEAALAGLPVVPAYRPLSPLLVTNDDALLDLLHNPRDEAEYIDRANALIRDPVARGELGRSLQARLQVDHIGDGWLGRLRALYEVTDRLHHEPHALPEVSCSVTPEDITFSLWRVMADGRSSSAHGSASSAAARARHVAFVYREAQNFPGARRQAWRALKQDPWCVASWRLLAVTALGGGAKRLRRLLPSHSS